MKENDNNEEINKEYNEPLNIDNYQLKNRRQSTLYVENDEPTLLRFNSIERDEEADRRNSTFYYNSEDDVFRINLSKLDKNDDKLQKKESKKDSSSQIFSKSSLESVKEEESENEEPRPKQKNKNKKKKKDYDENIRQNTNFDKKENLKNKEKKLTPLYIIVFCYLTFSIIELISGYYSNSIILISDALHYFSKSICFIIYIISIYVSKKNSINEIYFVINKGKILGVLISNTILWGFLFWLIYSAIMRILQPTNIYGLIIIIGILSTFFNFTMEFILVLSRNKINVVENNKKSKHFHSDDEPNYQPKKFVFQDFIYIGIQSCLIILVGIIIYFNQNNLFIDPICSLIFNFIFLINAYNRIENSIKILMEELPAKFDIGKIANDLLRVDGVIKVYDINVWNLSNGKNSMCCHLITSDPENSLIEARKLIKKKFNITHTAIQTEPYSDKLD